MDNKNLVARLKTLQRARSKRAFARFCDLSDSTMRGYLNGKRYPVPENLEKIAKAHETTTDWLISGRMPDIRSLSEEKQKLFFEQDPEVIDIEFESGSIFPVVKAYDNESTQLHFYCIHCSRWHHHGKDDIEAPYKEGRAGHWNAHCLAENSPFKIRGIILDIVGKYSEINKTIRKKRNPLICPRCSKYYSAAFNACSCGYQNKRRKSKFTPLPELYQAIAFVIPNSDLKELHDKEANITSKNIGKSEPYPPPKNHNIDLKELPSDIVELRRIPVLGNVPAGIPESIEEHIEEYILVPDAPPNSYALKVSGESMEPGIRHGDYIFFVIDREAKSGDVVVVNDEFGDSMIKRYKVKGDEQRLVSDNPAYPTYIPNNHYRIMGVVVGAMRKWKI